MTSQQRETIRAFVTAVRSGGYTCDAEWAERKEIKRIEVSPLFEGSKKQVLLIETGLKNDEKTLASVFCRDKWHVAIGPRGGVQSLSHRKQGFHTNLIYSERN